MASETATPYASTLAGNAFWTMTTFYLIFGLLYFNSVSGQDFTPDTMVNQINILDATSVRLKFKADTSKIDLSFTSRDSTFPMTRVENENGDQILTMIFHPGDSKYQFSEFKVSFLDKTSDKGLTIKLKDKGFKTGNGITLGTIKSELLRTLGKPTATREDNGLTIIDYKITNQDSGILNRYRQAEYFASYKFKDDKLMEFHFGFEYP